MANLKEVIVSQYSQGHVLQHYMNESKLSHDEKVLANVGPVRLEQYNGKSCLYFCPVCRVNVIDTISPGDGGKIPEDVSAHGLSVSDKFLPGLYELKNVILHSNGVISVMATEETEFVPL